MSTKARILSLLGAVLVVTAVACADSTTAPLPTGVKAARDTSVIEGDTTECRSGWAVVTGRYVCRDM
jgi:hypothetical protein